MEKTYPDIDSLIAKHLAGETDTAEQQALDAWLADDAEHRPYFEALQRLWEQAPQGRSAPERAVNTDAALKKVKARLRQNAAPMRVGYGRRFWAQAVAAAVVVLLAAVWFWPVAVIAPQEITSRDATLRDTLTDGSQVVLNRNSSLRMSDQFGQKERRARLAGEAFFQVAPDATRPFVVETGALEITVVGTEFNVDYITDAGRVVVAVSTGKVRLRLAQQVELLAAGEQAECELATGKITRRTAPDPNVLAYQNRQFRFSSTPLSEVVSQLSDVYGIAISLKNKALSNCPLTTHFDGLPLEQVLDIIAESFSLRIERSSAGIALDGEGCEN